jgi:competence protein ComEC
MVRGEMLPGLDYGRALKITGQPMFPRRAANESFDYSRYLYYQRIRLIFRTSSDGIEFAKTPGALNGVVVASRFRIKGLTEKVLRNDSAGLMLGILLGDTSDISSGLQDDFKATGLTHILAVSGLNVAMLLVICLFILRILRLRPYWQVILAASILGYYALITRGEPSVLRATIMALVGLGGWYLGRQKNLLSALSFAALLLLVYDPFLLYSVSFQLSFAATLALIVFCPILMERLEGLRLPGWVRDGVAVSLAAQLGVLPILAYYFNQVSLISLLANLLVVPATAPVLALGLAASALSWVSGALSHFTLYLSSLFLNYMITATRLLARIPWAAVDVSSPSFLQAGVYYLVVGVSMHALSLKKRGWDRKVLLLALLIVALVFWFRVLGNAPPSRLEATFFAVGQGDAALVRTPGGVNILIDGGENPSYMRRALVRKRVGRLDLVILSHPHADHVGGLPEVIRSKNVDTVFDAVQVHSAPGYVDFLRAVRERKVRYKKVRAGKTFKIGDELTLRILHPTEELVSGSISDLNNNSLVTRISYGKVSLLFPGDIEREGEENLLSHRSRSGLKSTVIKVPHHGSANGSDLGFLKAVAPRIAVISVGKGNSFGHPAKVTLKRLRSLGSRVYRTDRTGDVTIVTDGKEVAVRTQR